MIQRAIRFLVIALLLFAHQVLFSQNQDGKTAGSALEAHFIKPEYTQEAGILGFNVIVVFNPSRVPVKIKPELVVPEGWAIFSTAITQTTVPPNDSVMIPFRIRIPGQADSDEKHELLLNVFSASNELLLQTKCLVQPVSYHSWQLVIPQRRVYFYPRLKLAEFDVIIENNGNTHELVRLDVQPDYKVKIGNGSDWETGQQYYLGPQQDTTLHFRVYYTNPQERLFDISKIQIIAITDNNQDEKTVLIEKYIDTYDPFHLNYYLPHMTEAGLRMSSTSYDVTPFFNARGKQLFSRKSSFDYYFSNYNVNESENFIANSIYRFIYNWNTMKIGVGAIGSTLGRNIYSQNAIMVSNIFKLSKTSDVEIFISQDFVDPISSVAGGYTFTKKDLRLYATVGYNRDRVRMVNTGSFLFRTSQIQLFKGHSVNAILYALREDHSFTKPYTLQGYAWDVNYYGRIGQKFTFQLINNFGSPDLPGSRMGLLKIGANMKFMPVNPKKYFTATYVNMSRDFYNYTFLGEKRRNVVLHDQYMNLLYHSDAKKKNRWFIGPSIELYQSLTPLYSNDSAYADYKVQKVKLEFYSYLWSHLKFDVKAGIRNISYSADYIEIAEQKYDLNFIADYNLNGYGIRLRYDYGPMINSGLYQAATEIDFNALSLAPYISKYYFKKRLNVRLFANMIYRFDLDYAYVNFIPKIETFLVRDWYAVLGGSYTYNQRKNEEFDYSHYNYYLEFSIKKYWGKTERTKRGKKLRRLKVVLFQDENGNGEQDPWENGVPYVKTRLTLITPVEEDEAAFFPVDITLLSNEKGIVFFKQIPRGVYDISLKSLNDLKEYFYVDKLNESISLSTNRTVYIPFQKASRIEGEISMRLNQYSQENGENMDLANIKITAYNKLGNSYSSFTAKDGSFVIFAPGENTYHLRMKNVFGNNYAILQNDISVAVSDTTETFVVFDVVEQNRKINFKKTLAEIPDSLRNKPLKIKVLPGKIYENEAARAALRDSVPEFDLNVYPVEEYPMTDGLFYVVVKKTEIKYDAVAYIRIVKENGLKSFLGFDAEKMTYYVFTMRTSKKSETQQEIKRVELLGIEDARILKFKAGKPSK
ncbi:MAG: hypothetical protein L3J66_04630 [Bacteroidales bacterium]|nr:hypothetical protein [Bacteroidales bacterium]